MPEVEHAEHPFVLQFPVEKAALSAVTRHRQGRKGQMMSLLLNAVLIERIHLQARPRGVWAVTNWNRMPPTVKWVTTGYFAGKEKATSQSKISTVKLEELKHETYYSRLPGLDGKALRVPTSLDDAICAYLSLKGKDKSAFERAIYWIDLSSRQWSLSSSSAFASFAFAIEALGPRELRPARRFASVIKRYCEDTPKSDSAKIYELRSQIAHGETLMLTDEGLSFGWDPPSERESSIREVMGNVARAVIRNWLSERAN